MPSSAGRRAPTALVPVAVLAVVLWFAGSAAVWRATPQGLVLGNDSVTYWSSSLALRDGRGLTTPFENEYEGLPLDDKLAHEGAVPLTLWPPLTTVSLRVADAVLPGSPERAARELQALLAGATCALTGVLAWWLSSRGRLGLLAGAVAGIALAVHPSFVVSHVLLSSEPLFLALQTAGLVALLAALRRPNAGRIVLASGLAAAAGMSRIAGAALGLTVGAAIALAAPLSPTRRRVLVGGLSGAAALAPLALWQLTRGGGPARGVAWHGRAELFGDLARTARATVLPGPPSLPGATPSGPTVWALLVAGAIVGAAAVGWITARAQGHRRDLRDALVVVGHGAALVGLLLVTAVAVDRTFPIDTRTTLPLLPGTFAVVAAGAAHLARAARGARAPVAPAIAVAGLAIGTCAAAIALGTQADRTASQWWRRPVPGIEVPRPRDAAGRAIAALPPELVLFSNQPAATWVRSGRGALALPTATYPMTGRTNPAADDEAARVADLVADGRAVIVIDQASRFFTTFLVDPDRFANDPRLQVGYTSDGVMIITARPA